MFKKGVIVANLASLVIAVLVSLDFTDRGERERGERPRSLTEFADFNLISSQDAHLEELCWSRTGSCLVGFCFHGS